MRRQAEAEHGHVTLLGQSSCGPTASEACTGDKCLLLPACDNSSDLELTRSYMCFLKYPEEVPLKWRFICL